MKSDRIDYRVEFYSFWHCGSGLAAGADADALVIKDDNRLPFIPGKTIKGLIKQAVEEIALFGGKGLDSKEIDDLFGEEGVSASPLFFSNATLVDADSIIENRLQDFLTNTIANTQIDDNGTAKKGSLRKTEVVIPCSLKGSITGIPDENKKQVIVNSLPYIKNLGLHRNRGLGRCSITVED